MNTRVISVAILLVAGASGCATGGSKLGHDELFEQRAANVETIRVCRQFGPKVECWVENRQEVEADFELMMQTQGFRH